MYGFSWLPSILIFNFERLLYARNVRLTFPYSTWLGTTGTSLGFGICIYMRTWCLDFDICGAFELVDLPLMQLLARDHNYAPIVLFGRVFMHVRY